jgi:ribonuclease HI
VALHVPKKVTTVRSKPWWSKEIDQKREIMNGRWREWKATRTTPARNQFSAVRNSFFIAIRDAKSKNWNDFLKGARGKDIFTAMRYTKPRRVDPTPDIIVGQEKASTFKEKAALFRRALFPPPPTADVQEEDPNPMRRLPWPRTTSKEIRDAIMSSSSSKAPGPDGLGFECLKVAYQTIPEYFDSLYEVLIRAGYHPRAWREATIVILRKSGKPDYSIPKAYRPISLLNCLGKVSEKIMATRLAYMAERHHLLHRLQIGGRPKRSAVDAAMFLTTKIDEANKRNKTTSTLCIDVKGAFDNVYKKRLLQTMRAMKLDQKTVRWVDSFLSDRMASLSFDKDTEQMSGIDTGIPQGSPVSPILFLFYLTPLFTIMELKHPNVICPSYIDDICLMVVGDSPAENSKILEDAVATCFQWGEDNAVAFDDPKSELMHFYKARKEIQTPYTNVVLPNGTCIKPSGVQRWLGFWLDRKLTWKFHIQTRTTSAMRVFMALSRLGNTERGLSQSALRQLYQSCITTVADFGAEVWWNQQKVQTLPFQRLQNQAMRKIAGAFKTTPVAALEAELGLPPADLRLDRAQRGYATRLLTLPEQHPILGLCPDTFPKTLDNEREDYPPGNFTHWYERNPFKPKYESRLTRILSLLNNKIQPPSIIETIDVTAAAPWDNTSFLDIHIPEGPKDIVAQKHRDKHFFTHSNTEHLCFYTDGSLLEGKAGAGIHASRADETIHESKHYLGTETEVFDAELYGIMKAAETAVTLTRDNKTTDVWIFCDNQSAVRRMADKRPFPGQEYVLKTHSSAEILAKREIKTHIHWVPGHVNVKGNERADQLAKQGTEGKRIPRDASTSITFLRRANKEQQMTAWLNRWPTMKKGRSYHGRPARNIHTTLRHHPSRKLVATIIQMRTGHGYNKQYLSRIPSTNIDSPKCTCGYRTQTPQHLLLDCSIYRTQRDQLKKQLKPLRLTWQTAMHTGKGLQGVMKFLEDTGVGTRTWMLGPRLEEAGGFGWAHMRDDDEGGEHEEDGGRSRGRGEGVGTAEVVGVG